MKDLSMFIPTFSGKKYIISVKIFTSYQLRSMQELHSKSTLLGCNYSILCVNPDRTNPIRVRSNSLIDNFDMNLKLNFGVLTMQVC